MFRQLYNVIRAQLWQRLDLVLEHVALQQQLRVLQRLGRPPRFSDGDRLFWVLLSRTWDGWREALVVVQPQTVNGWRRRPWRYWLQRRDRRPPGRPPIDTDIQALIRCMRRENFLWGAPRIHGELLKLGIQVAESTVAKYMGRRIGTPSPTWRAFLRNEAHALSLQAEFRLPESLENALRQVARLPRRLVAPTQTPIPVGPASCDSALLPNQTSDPYESI